MNCMQKQNKELVVVLYLHTINSMIRLWWYCVTECLQNACLATKHAIDSRTYFARC